MIKQLTSHGFKDQTRTLKLSGCDLITSNSVNGVGKSAVLEAFKLALTGEVPGRAKSLDDILQFTSQDEMKVEVVAECRRGPVVVERGFLRHAPRGEKRPIWIDRVAHRYEEGSQWVREHIGAVSISFDPYEFLNLSDDKKRQWIIAHSPESQRLSQKGLDLLLLSGVIENCLGAGVVHSLLLSFGIASLDEVAGVLEESDLCSLRSRLADVFHRQEPERLKRTLQILDKAFRLWSSSESSEQNSGAMLKFLKSETLRLKNAVREHTAALSSLWATLNDDGQRTPHDISDCRKEIQRLDHTIAHCERRLQTLRVRSAEKIKKDKRMDFLQENISRLADHLDGEMGEALRSMRTQWVEKLVDTWELQEKHHRLDQDLARRSADLKEQESRLSRWVAELKLKRDKRENLGSTHFACPVARQIRCETDMNPYRKNLDKEIEALSRREADIRESLRKGIQKIQSCKQQVDELDAKLARDLRGNRNAQREIDLIDEQILSEEKETAKIRGMLKAYREECALLQADPVRTFADEDKDKIDTLENEKNALIHLKDEVQKTLDEQLCRQGKMEALSELRGKKKQWELELEIVRQVAELISGVQEKMASRIAGALEKEVNDTLKLIDSRYDFILNLQGGHFEMGWNRDGKVIPFKTMNSAHFVLFIVPFLVALMKRIADVRKSSGLPTLKALCIEAESLTPGNLTALLRGLRDMKEKGGFDNVLVAHYQSIKDTKKLWGFQEHVLEAWECSIPA